LPNSAPAAAAALITLAFGWACAAFVAQPALATFADDSMSYLVMAQVFSPWHDASAPVREAFVREAFYPPLFPLLLALAGATHDTARAYVASAVMLAACLPVLYLFSTRLLSTRWAAVAAVAITAILPALWINAKGILSEPLYCLALLGVIWAAERRHVGILVLCVTALVLTRTAGVALVAAYAAWALTQRDRMRLIVPVAFAAMAYGVWLLLRPAGTADLNVAFLAQQGWRPDFGRQAQSIAEAWIGSLMIYWVEDRPVRTALAGLAGILALSGLIVRLAGNKADAWVMSAYVLTFLLWPFHDQMGRFIFPALPVLVVYGFYAAETFARAGGRSALVGHAVAAVLIASLAAPALAFLHQRSTGPTPYPDMVDWYRYPDWREAQRRADIHIGLLQDMRTIADKTPESARVMWVTPGYIALLAGRRGVPAPDSRQSAEAYRAALAASGADYVFLSAYHPRDTLSDAAWQSGLRALSGRFEATNVRKHGEAVASILFRVK
jgi:hypothetical protein